MPFQNIDPTDKQAVLTVAFGLMFCALALFVVTRVLKFRFVMGVGD